MLVSSGPRLMEEEGGGCPLLIGLMKVMTFGLQQVSTVLMQQLKEAKDMKSNSH